ncbi:MAG: cytochrome C [Candidatus Thiodiazotropha sp.]|jgi:hypothetical protein
MMKRGLIWILAPIFLLMLTGAGMVLADRHGYDDDDDHEGGERGFFSRWMSHERMAYNTDNSPLYQEECGSCHFPFQPGFLPADSWIAIMRGLQDHFGDNAELSDENTQRITEFLVTNAAGRVDREISNKAAWSLRYTPQPERITETAFFRHEHREIPPRIMNQTDNKLSFVNCDSCHQRALQGSFNEHEVRIPGVGRWED